MIRISLAAAVAALVFAVPSCSTETEASTTSGNYIVDVKPTLAASMMALPADAPQTQNDMMSKALTGMFEKTAYELKADLTYSLSSEMDLMGSVQKISEKGTWTVKDGKLTLTKTEQDGKKLDPAVTETGTIKDGKITLTAKTKNGDMVVHLIKKK